MSPSGHPDRAAIEAGQLDSLQGLLAELIPANRFYTRKLQATGLGFDVGSLADFSRRFPFTSKDELVRDQVAHPPFGSNLTYPFDRYTRFHQTSGTTGHPLRWLDTPESWDAMIVHWMEVFREAGVGSQDRVYFAFSFGPFIGFWMAFESAQRIGCLCLPGGGLGSRARLRAILDNGATALCCTPTYAIRLGEVAREEGVSLSTSAVRRILVAGEPGGSIAATRRHIEELWPGARVFDHHGMTEVGPVTYECSAVPGRLHVMEQGHFAEIVEPGSGIPMKAGEAGELILTPLDRVASPLLRYRTGDLVRSVQSAGASAGKQDPVEASCACGHHELALEGGILGRVDDMVIVRGVNVYPSAIEGTIREVGGIAEYQVLLTRSGPLTELTVKVEPRPDCVEAASLRGRLERRFESSLSLRVPVEIVSAGTLPRFEMKAKRWVRA
jgi:phenylacetate-CoA ligase